MNSSAGQPTAINKLVVFSDDENIRLSVIVPDIGKFDVQTVTAFKVVLEGIVVFLAAAVRGKVAMSKVARVFTASCNILCKIL